MSTILLEIHSPTAEANTPNLPVLFILSIFDLCHSTKPLAAKHPVAPIILQLRHCLYSTSPLSSVMTQIVLVKLLCETQEGLAQLFGRSMKNLVKHRHLDPLGDVAYRVRSRGALVAMKTKRNGVSSIPKSASSCVFHIRSSSTDGSRVLVQRCSCLSTEWQLKVDAQQRWLLHGRNAAKD